MDIPKTYIRMCNHPLIQGQWLPKIGVYYQWWDRQYKEVRQAIWTKDCSYNLVGFREGFIWLPTQGQIQEMINYCSTNFICGIYDWFIEIGGEEKEFSPSSSLNSPSPKSASEKTGTTYEQLWLAFYMHEYHKLIWDGTEWIKEK